MYWGIDSLEKLSVLDGGLHIIVVCYRVWIPKILFDESEEHFIHTIGFGDEPHGIHVRPRTI